MQKTLIFIIICLLSYQLIQLVCTHYISQDAQKIYLISIPKCGTHLLAELITLLTGMPYISVGTHNNFSTQGAQTKKIKEKLLNLHDTYLLGHTTYDAELEKMLNAMQIKTFFIYRDPRDHMVSYSYYIQRPDAPAYIKEWTEKNSFDALLDSFFTGDFILYKYWYAKKIDDFYRLFLPWLKCKNVCAIRFEDLVGSNGGGSIESQYLAIEKIAHHIGIQLDENDLQDITEKLFGSGFTFRKGQIGAWKTHFNNQHIKKCKEVAGNLLIDLGYEENLNW